MATALDKLKSSAVGAGGAALTIGPEIMAADNKLIGLLNGLKELAKWQAAGWLGVIAGGFIGIRSAIGLAVKESGALEQALENIRKQKGFEKAMSPYVKGITQARSRMAELLKLRKASPFGMDELTGAAHKLTVYTRGVSDSATVIGELSDMAAGLGVSLDDVAEPYGRLVQAMASGQGIDEAIADFQRFGTLTVEQASQLRDLARAGMPLSDMLNVVRDGMGKTNGAAAAAGQEIDALRTRYEELKRTAIGNFGMSFMAAEKATLDNMVAGMTSLAPIATEVGEAVGNLVGHFTDFWALLFKVTAAVPGLGGVLAAIINLFTVFGEVVTAVAGVKFLVFIGTATKSVWGFGSSLVNGSRAAALMASATEYSAKATALQGEAAVAAAAGNKLLEYELKAAAMAAEAQALGLKGAAFAAEKTGAGIGWLGTKLKGLLAAAPELLILVGIMWGIQKVMEHFEHQEAMAKLSTDIAFANTKLIEQLDAMKTLDDQQKALADSTNALADAQIALGAALAKADRDPQEISIRRQAVKNAQAAVDRAKAGKGVSGMGEAQRALMQRRSDAALALRQEERETLISLAPGGAARSQMRRQQGYVLSAKASEGFAAQTDRAGFEAKSSATSTQLIKAKEVRDALRDKLEETKNNGPSGFDLFKEQLGIGRGGRWHQAATREAGANYTAANQKVQALEEEMQQRKLKAANRFIRREAEIDQAEKEHRMSTLDAQKARTANETERKDIEGNASEHQRKAMEIKTEEISRAILSEKSGSVSSLQAIAGGGNVGAGTDPHIQAIQKGNATLESIKALLDGMIGQPEQDAARKIDLLPN